MSREIKFRGKDTEGEWIYGDLIHGAVIDGNTVDVAIKELGMYPQEVDEETVGQILGKIKNDEAEIWEGDVIQHGESIRIIEFRSGNTFAIRPSKDGTILLSYCRNPIKLGNVHDNPDLIK